MATQDWTKEKSFRGLLTFYNKKNGSRILLNDLGISNNNIWEFHHNISL
jgi:hypothetical protein